MKKGASNRAPTSVLPTDLGRYTQRSCTSFIQGLFMSDRRWYRYGITQETYEQMLFEQDGVCAACRCEPTIIKGIERPVLA